MVTTATGSTGRASASSVAGLTQPVVAKPVRRSTNYAKGVLYGTVDRPDIKQYREFYATPETVAALRKGDPIPSGTVLTMVQYKAELDAQGNPLKDANGRFVKGDLAGFPS